VVGTQTTSDLVLIGDNFGLMGTVIFDHNAVATTSWSHRRITLSVLALSGNITVVSGR
jgi:hypothetical protein